MPNERRRPRTNLQEMVQKQVQKVLVRGQRYERFDQIRQRHFYSTHLFTPGAGNIIPAGRYDIFITTASGLGQGYPIPLTERETNWKGTGRVPDNQNFVIQELGVTVQRPPAVDTNTAKTGQPQDAPLNGIYANLPPAIQALIAGNRPISSQDAKSILLGGTLEMGFLTNFVPLGFLSDFSQSSGCYSQMQPGSATPYAPAALQTEDNFYGDPVNGVPAAAFRRKLEVPILLQHGEQTSMRINFPRDIRVEPLIDGGTGWLEIRVDWWATESFVEYS